MKTPSIPALTWTIAVAAVLCAVWLAASESSGPENVLFKLFEAVPAAFSSSPR